jgi:3-oxoadipate enol-lactonase
MIHFSAYGSEGKPCLVLGSSLGTSGHMWANLVPSLAETFHVIVFDTRGHGKSQHLSTAGLGVADFAGDVIALLDSLRIERFSYAGLSLGGAIGQQLALSWPERVNKLVLCCTAAKFGEAKDWQNRAAKVRQEGMAWLYEPIKARWYSPGFAEENAFARELLTEMLAIPPQAYADVCDAMAAFDACGSLAQITCPTLAIAGANDLATPVPVMQELARGIPGARLIIVKGAAHLGNVERPGEFLEAIREFA